MTQADSVTGRALALLVLGCVFQQLSGVAAAQETRVTGTSTEVAATAKAGIADGASSSDSLGKRRPLYRLGKSDVLEINFTFAEEFDQTASVQPDGFISLKGLDNLYAEGMTLGELREAVQQAYRGMLHDPEVTIVLKDFEKPYFIASGQVARPGKYDLRGEATVTEGLAIAGGLTDAAKHSEVVLFRPIPGEQMETRLFNVKQMLNSRNLAEDLQLRPGDVLFVPQNRISKIRRYLPVANLSTYVNPAQF